MFISLSAMPPIKRPRGHALRIGRHSQSGQTYLVTTVTRKREPFFVDFSLARCVIQTLRQADAAGQTQTWAFVLMPDHMHWLFTLAGTFDLSRVVRDVKSVSSHRCGCVLWQRGFHDPAIRSEASLKDVARYVIFNPVRAGLVGRVGNYAHWDAAWA